MYLVIRMSKTIRNRRKVLEKYIQTKWGDYYAEFLTRNILKHRHYYYYNFTNIPNMEFVEKHIEHPTWDWQGISKSPQLTINMIEKYPDKFWDWYCGISNNSDIILEIIKNNKFMDKNLNWISISKNPIITTRIIEEYPDKPWNWKLGISYNPNITIEFINKYGGMCKQFDWKAISKHKNITMDIIEKYPDKPWNWKYISFNPNITIEFINKYPDKPWNWKHISSHRKITMKIIEKYPDKPWDWKGISQNPNLSIRMLDKYKDKQWSWRYISHNQNLTIELLKNYKYLDKPLNWASISSNPNLTMEIIEKYPDKPWDWMLISQCINITLDMIYDNARKSWVWYMVAKNPNLTFDIIEKLPKIILTFGGFYLDWYSIAGNSLTKEKKLFYHKYYRIYLATFRLQQYFNRMYDNPKYLFCRNRLDKLFSGE